VARGGINCLKSDRRSAANPARYEVFHSVVAAIQRESNIKYWPRKWKLDLIEKLNPQWRDLAEEAAWRGLKPWPWMAGSRPAMEYSEEVMTQKLIGSLLEGSMG